MTASTTAKRTKPSARQHADGVRITTAFIEQLMLQEHPQGEWALLFEVAPRTGGGTRYADAVAMNLWKSRAYAVHGFEFKVSRSDWLRELKSPAKADEVFGYCDHFWIVAAPGIVNPEELPAKWGLLEPVLKRGVKLTSVVDGQSNDLAAAVCNWKLQACVQAQPLDPQPLSREFFASLMRRGHDSIQRTAARHTEQRASQREALMQQEFDRQLQSAQRELTSIKERIQKFKEETGLEFGRWSGPSKEHIELARQLQSLSRHGGEQLLSHLDELSARMTRDAQNISSSADKVRQVLVLANDPSGQTGLPGETKPTT